jgi:hypothetical protein
MPVAWALPRSSNCVTVAGSMSTHTVGVVDGRQFPTATEWSIVASIRTRSASWACSRIAVWASTASVIVSGSGPSSRIDPAMT